MTMPEPTRLRFSAAGWGHRYALDGNLVPSVTTVLNASLNKPGLVGSAVKLTAAWCAINVDSLHRSDVDGLRGPGLLDESQWRDLATKHHRNVWNEARDVGVNVHTIAEQLVYGAQMPAAQADGTPWTDDVTRMAEQLADFMDRTSLRPVVHESLVYHAVHRYAGRFDLIADLDVEGVRARWLLDYKTGASGVWGEASLQATAYRAATHVQIERDGDLVDVDMPAVDQCGALWVRPDGWELLPLTTNADQFDAFLAALRLYPWTKRKRDELVGWPALTGHAKTLDNNNEGDDA